MQKDGSRELALEAVEKKGSLPASEAFDAASDRRAAALFMCAVKLRKG
jgi:hypothetical protein